MATITCRQVILVSTKTTQVGLNDNPVTMTDPKSTATQQDTGDQNIEQLSNTTVTQSQLAPGSLPPSAASEQLDKTFIADADPAVAVQKDLVEPDVIRDLSGLPVQ